MKEKDRILKKTLGTLIFLILVLISFIPASGVDVDPILIDKPNFLVQECSEELFFEVLVDPIIAYNTGGRKAEDLFFFLTAELLYLRDDPWKGLDKGSFTLKRTLSDGTEEYYPLNYMMTMMLSLKNGWKTLSDELAFPRLLKMTLVFDVKTLDKKGWSLIVAPAERGGEAACEIEVPLRVQY